jgi:hypothetical protein
MPAGFSFGVGPEPSHSLASDVIQAPLECSAWPDQFDSPDDRLFTVCGYVPRVKPLALKIAKPGIGLLKGLLLNVRVGDNLLIFTVHKIQEATVFVKVGGIIKHITHSGVIHLLNRCLFKPVIFDLFKCGRTVSRKLSQSPDRITLHDPQPEPHLAAVGTIRNLLPCIGVPTLQTLVALFERDSFPIKSNRGGTT